MYVYVWRVKKKDKTDFHIHTYTHTPSYFERNSLIAARITSETLRNVGYSFFMAACIFWKSSPSILTLILTFSILTHPCQQVLKCHAVLFVTDVTMIIPIEKAIETYFKNKPWATPKELKTQLTPILKQYGYDEATIRVLIHRKLKSLGIIAHPLRPFYVYEQSLDWFNLFISHSAKENRLNFLYKEGFSILYEGEITVKINERKKDVFEGRIILIPNVNNRSKEYLMVAKEGKF